mgnify:CR=1 FL=1
MRKHRKSQYSYRGKRTPTASWLVPILVIALTLVIVFSVAACGRNLTNLTPPPLFSFARTRDCSMSPATRSFPHDQARILAEKTTNEKYTGAYTAVEYHETIFL